MTTSWMLLRISAWPLDPQIEAGKKKGRRALPSSVVTSKKPARLRESSRLLSRRKALMPYRKLTGPGIEQLNKVKQRTEKEKNAIQREYDESSLKLKADEQSRQLKDLGSSERRLNHENSDSARQLDEAKRFGEEESRERQNFSTLCRTSQSELEQLKAAVGG
ncbi:unnamed protein product, partial [Mesorhabditis spiculigera]